MKNYIELMVKCRDEGTDVFNERTGKTCRTIVGAQLEFNLENSFPAVTSKRLAFKAVKGELLGFFRGYTNAADFRVLDCNIWNANANETKAWLDNPLRKGTDDLGKIYGHNWTNWEDTELVSVDKVAYLETKGYKCVGSFTGSHDKDGDTNLESTYVMQRRINQLEKALHTIITNPSDRRIIVSAWNVGDLDKASLPPCHIMYTFVPIGNTLSVVMHQRSCDALLGIPFNIASTALFLSIMAKLAGLTPGKVILQMVNYHIYEDHFDALEKQLANPLYELPTLHLSDNIKQITDVKDIPGVFTRINPEDISLVNYQCNDSIRAPMAA